jgi:hypothetical protein
VGVVQAPCDFVRIIAKLGQFVKLLELFVNDGLIGWVLPYDATQRIAIGQQVSGADHTYGQAVPDVPVARVGLHLGPVQRVLLVDRRGTEAVLHGTSRVHERAAGRDGRPRALTGLLNAQTGYLAVITL